MTSPISPVELVMSMLQDTIDTSIVGGGVVVGPTDDAQRQLGCLSIADAGTPKQERYLPLVWVRTQIRVFGPTYDTTDRIARHVYELLNGKGRTLIQQSSTAETYLVHMVNITSGPTVMSEDSETWEELLFAEALIGTDPVAV
jgi:hypothetical protein